MSFYVSETRGNVSGLTHIHPSTGPDDVALEGKLGRSEYRGAEFQCFKNGKRKGLIPPRFGNRDHRSVHAWKLIMGARNVAVSEIERSRKNQGDTGHRGTVGSDRGSWAME